MTNACGRSAEELRATVERALAEPGRSELAIKVDGSPESRLIAELADEHGWQVAVHPCDWGVEVILRRP
jgi:hypothetical protein